MDTTQPQFETISSEPTVLVDLFHGEKQYPPIRWWEKIAFKLKLSQIGLVIILIGATITIMFTVERSLLIEQGENLAEQLGNRVVSELESRVTLAESLTSSLANLGERLGTDVDAFMRVVPGVLDYEGQESFIAGGGIWPEPGAFLPEIEKRSFFWGREPDGKLKYFDDYNDPDGNGYHQEEWYVPATYYPAGQAFWSKSYVDPYSNQPMVTCSVPMIKEGLVSGVATVDLNLQGLYAFLDESSKVLGGYLFLVDRNNKFLSFPDPQMVKRVSADDIDNSAPEFLYASELAQLNNSFSPVADALEKLNTRIIDEAEKSTPKSIEIAYEMEQRSYQIDEQEARLTAAILTDPLHAVTIESNEVARLYLDNSVLFDKPVMVSIFHMPKTYWKLVIVTPMSEFHTAADIATVKVGSYVIGLELSGLVFMFLIIKKLFMRPLSQMTSEIVEISDGDKGLHQQLSDESRNELGQLAFQFNRRTNRMIKTMDELQESQVTCPPITSPFFMRVIS